MKLGKRFTPCFPFDKNPVQVCGILFSEGVISHKTANSLGRSRRERKWSYGSRTANAGKNTDRDSQRRDRSPLCPADACGDRCKNRRYSAVRAGIGFCRCDIYGQLRYRVDYGQTPDNGGDRRKRDPPPHIRRVIRLSGMERIAQIQIQKPSCREGDFGIGGGENA